MRKQKMMDRPFLHWHDGLLDRDRAVFADELIQAVGMSWNGQCTYQEWIARKTMRQQMNELRMKAHMTKILVIDDDARDRELLAAVLEERGYEVILADNGGTGLMLCHRQTPDAVVLDLNMPRIDGRSLLRQLRILHPTLPVVVFSGLRTEEIEQEMLNQGATAFIQKAFSLDQLGAALQEVLPFPTQANSWMARTPGSSV
jgi:two-component system, OmpR family, response regulator